MEGGMSVRRTAALLCAVFTGLTSGAAITAPAAQARPNDLVVRIRDLSGTFQAGGDPGSLTVAVAKRGFTCVLFRRVTVVRIAGVRADDVRLEREVDGRLRPVRMEQAGDGAVRAVEGTEAICRRDIRVATYKLAFRAGSPTGRAALAAQAVTAAFGVPLGRADATRKVAAARQNPPPPPPNRPGPNPPPKATPTATAPANPTPTATAPASPTPTATAPVPDGTAPPAETSPAIAPAGADGAAGGGPWLGVGSYGLGGVVLLFGLILFGIGAAVLVFLLRRTLRGPARAVPPKAGGQPMPTPQA
jgi:hypothetical protein